MCMKGISSRQQDEEFLPGCTNGSQMTLCCLWAHVQDKSAGMMGMGKGMLGKGMDEKPLGEVRNAQGWGIWLQIVTDRKFLDQGVRGFCRVCLETWQTNMSQSTVIG